MKLRNFSIIVMYRSLQLLIYFVMRKLLAIICLMAVTVLFISADVIGPAPAKVENNIAPAIVKSAKKLETKRYKCKYTTYSSCKYRRAAAWKGTCNKNKTTTEESNLVTP